MAEAVLNWPVIIDAIEAELVAVQNSAGAPAFNVIPGEPLGLPLGGPHACFWYLGRTSPRKSGGAPASLANVMYAARIQIACFWLVQSERSTLEAWDADIATIDTNLRRAFRANSTINNNLTDLEISDSDVGYGPALQGAAIGYRALMFELILDNLEGEQIAP